MIKILVDELPNNSRDCVFSIKGENGYPDVCKLKIGVPEFTFGITFSQKQYINCSLCEGMQCKFLKKDPVR